MLMHLHRIGRAYSWTSAASSSCPFQQQQQQQQRQQGHTAAMAVLGASLIPYDDTWGNLAVLTGSATGAQFLGNTTRIGQLLGPPVTAMALTFALASIGVLSPGGTPAAKSLQLLALNIATPLILLGADLEGCWERCGPLLLSFAVASVATIVACLVGWKVAGTMLQSALGCKDGLAIAAALMSKNIGGGINYIAVCRALDASPQAIAAGLCIDNLAALVYFPMTNALGSGQSDIAVAADTENGVMDNPNNNNGVDKMVAIYDDRSTDSGISVPKVCTAVFASCGLLWLGERFARGCFQSTSAQLPFCTVLAVVVASIAPNQWLHSIRETCNTLGTACLYLFFSTAGAPGSQVAASVQSSIGPLSLFLTCLYGIHGSILWLCHWLWGRRRRPRHRVNGKTTTMSFWSSAFVPQRLLVASSSAIGGPATSVALAESNGWKSLVVPAILVGNIGYVIATFCGLAYYYGLLR
ncbi:putative integral membrane protein [Nitzschia inconspicua]|uniref:Integral membrane protein n=1 Tax=Nitzschia inconspicua TaxID=303405 RepID=A0A9K3LI76_9STRA|nr:putative integral membrane protein [Nitzschia inconspicua]KAG7362154.1 putative integral membrane protein [Nitzschia inconspicua]